MIKNITILLSMFLTGVAIGFGIENPATADEPPVKQIQLDNELECIIFQNQNISCNWDLYNFLNFHKHNPQQPKVKKQGRKIT